MVDLAREAFSTNNFGLAADIYERTIRENGPTSELFLGLADSFARGGQFSKAFIAYTNAYRYGKVTPEKLKHLVLGLIETVKTDLLNSGNQEGKQPKRCMFTCGKCLGLLTEPVTIPCGHTFCRKCLEKDKSKTCVLCSSTHYRLKLKNLSSNFVLSKFIELLFPSGRRVANLKKEGNECVGKGDYRKAIEAYSKAIEIAPEDHLLLSNRCHALASQDLFNDALKDAIKVLELRPDWPKGYFRKGVALYGLGKYEDAAVSFLQCLSLDQKVSSAKEYLSKTLDKILCVLPPDDPKAFALEQQCNPSLLRQLIDKDFSRPLLLPNIADTLSDLAKIVKDTICVANEFSNEPTPNLRGNDQDNGAGPSKEKDTENHGTSVDVGAANLEQAEGLSKKLRCNSLPDVSEVDHVEILKITKPRTHSPEPSPLCRKRLRNPSASTVCPKSPTHSSPNKVFKSSKNTAEKSTSEDKEHSHTKPEALCVDDLECGLCYRLFFEPVTTPCGHTFCRKCLDRCLDHTSVCPMCKGNLAEYLAERRQTVTDAIQCIIDTYFKEEAAERSKLNDEEMIELAKMGSGQQSDIPIFVCIMAFPTISCPLHIFEPRYRLMVRQCMESGTRQFGMCMQETDDEFSTYGCMLEIRDVQYFPDGRSVVDTIGGRRFKVLSKGHRDGYSTAKVEFITDTPISPEDQQAVLEMQKEVYSMVQNWIAKLPSPNQTRINQHFGEQPPIENTPASVGNGPAWAWWAMNVLPLDPKVQMTLLAMTSFKDRLVALKKVLVYMQRRNRQ